MVLLAAVEASSKLEEAIRSLVEHGSQLGFTIIKALIVFLVGRLVINLLNKLVRKILSKRDIDPSVKTFVGSLVNVSLTILLIISVVGALSGNLSNFAGGLIILLFKPYKVGDYIEAQGVGGTVKEVQMFHTVLGTVDNKVIYIPNGSLSSGVVTNFSNQTTRRVDWTFGVEYGSDYEKVKQVIESVLAKDSRILSEPAAPFIALTALADSSVNVVVRVWVNSSDYWGVYFDINKNIYATFNEVGIGFPFPQLTVHQAKD